MPLKVDQGEEKINYTEFISKVYKRQPQEEVYPSRLRASDQPEDQLSAWTLELLHAGRRLYCCQLPQGVYHPAFVYLDQTNDVAVPTSWWGRLRMPHAAVSVSFVQKRASSR